MEHGGEYMDNIGLQPSPELLAGQVTKSRYFFLPLRRTVSPKGLRVALGGWEVCRADYVVRRSRYPFHVVELVLAGAGQAVVDGRVLKLEPGVCFAYGPRSRCELRTDHAQPLRKVFFGLSGGSVPVLLREAGLRPGRVRRSLVLGDLAEFAEAIIEEGRRQSRNTEEICALLARAFLLKIGENDGEGEAEMNVRARASFEGCRTQVDAQARTWNSLADIARGCGLERSSVCRLFRRFAGITPGRYLMRRKMNLAAAHLVEHGGLIKESAAYVGMSDPFYFSRCFRQIHGVPPSALLRR